MELLKKTILIMSIYFVFALSYIRVDAGTIYDSPYVTFSPDGKAFSTNEGDKDIKWYEKGVTVDTGIVSTIRELKTGEHYYSESRIGSIPVGKWEVVYKDHKCIHDTDTLAYHGLNYKVEKCFSKLYSGWMGICADCGGQFTPMMIYMSKEAAQSLNYVDISKDYFYICPFNYNLEIGAGFQEHRCKAISWNKYSIVYDKNAKDAGGYMSSSTHIYNNECRYEGGTLNPDTRLRKNTYIRIGYQFIGWNTKPDGTGKWYGEQEEVINLTDQDINISPKDAVVYLYAQWSPTRNTLHINPAGGTYNEKSGVTSLVNDYSAVYRPDSGLLKAPAGFTVAFQTQGGNKLSPIEGSRFFREWQLSDHFNGKWENGVYTYQGPDGSEDTLTAVYEMDSITLPLPEKENVSFAGWYYDKECVELAGYAGETLTPEKNITLYAKWVSLLLTGENNYTANNRKGAVDLSWLQPDSVDKSYVVEQKREGNDWLRLASAQEDNINPVVNKTFGYTGRTMTYLVPYTGLYTLTASGAQGGDYGGKAGGKGGRVMGKFWLESGEKITYTVGGRNGFNGGGQGNIFADGGGCTVVKTDRKDTVLIAGGGGGATSQGEGGSGGSKAGILATGIEGESGGAGGGGGYRGGRAGELVKHNHSLSCYHIESLEYTALDAYAVNEYTRSFHEAQEIRDMYYLWVQEVQKAKEAGLNVYIDGYPESVGGMYLTGGFNTFGSEIDLGKRYYHVTGKPNYQVVSYEYLPVKGNVKAVISASFSGWGAGYGTADMSMEIYDDKNNLLKRVDSSQLPEMREEVLQQANDEKLQRNTRPTLSGRSYGVGLSGNTDINGNDGLVSSGRIYMNNVEVDVSGTKGIRIRLYGSATFVHNGASIDNITFQGGEKKYLVCAYADKPNGYIISSKPAYGGSSYVNKEHTSSYQDNAGRQSGSGSFMVKGELLGYQTATKMKDVPAADMAAPDAPDASRIRKTAAGMDKLRITWEQPEDNGTRYYHRVTSYTVDRTGSLTKSLDSNIIENTLVTGIAGYRYKVTENEEEIPLKTWEYTDVSRPYAEVAVKKDKQYLFVAAVDVAGNMSRASRIELEAAGEPDKVAWPLSTGQIVVEEGESIYYDATAGNYYMRADGTASCTMSYSGYINGIATVSYQINQMDFLVNGSGDQQQFSVRAPNWPVLTSGKVGYHSRELDKTITEPEYLRDAAYTQLSRNNWLKETLIVQKFTADPAYSGKQLLIVPRVGAEDSDGRIVWSDEKEDVKNGLSLILDGEPPVITGTEILKGMETIDWGDGEIMLYLKAEDGLSGLKELMVHIKNTDNYCEKTYSADSSGRLEINITEDDFVFNGDFIITITASDQVGNRSVETYGATEFSLQVTLERILSPHAPVFKCGESGVLTIITTGYADKVEVIFPDAMLTLNPELNKSYIYEVPDYLQEESLEFMVPLYTPEGEYEILVNAYKDGRVLHEHPKMSAAGVEGSVLGEIRTRLR